MVLFLFFFRMSCLFSDCYYSSEPMQLNTKPIGMSSWWIDVGIIDVSGCSGAKASPPPHSPGSVLSLKIEPQVRIPLPCCPCTEPPCIPSAQRPSHGSCQGRSHVCCGGHWLIAGFRYESWWPYQVPGDPTRYQPPREPHGFLICRCQNKWRLTAFLLQVTTSHLSGFVLLRVLGSYCLYTGKLLTSMY